MSLPDVYLLSGFPYGLHQNVYAVDCPEENRMFLIDTGLEDTDLNVIQENIKRWKLSDRNIEKVFLTHSHFDHCGNAAFFETKGCQIYVGEEDADAVLTGNEHTLTFAYGMDFPPCKEVIKLKDGDRIVLSDKYSLIAHHTPGHTPGSICYELAGGEQTVLFTGDFIQPAENPEEVRLGIKVDCSYDYSAYVQSARKLSRKKFDCIFAGHYHQVLHPNNLTGIAYRELLVNRSLYK